MIITCEKCSTKFNLDESILKKEGSKVRCSMCKHIFTAYPCHDEKPESQKELPIEQVTTIPQPDEDTKSDTNDLNIVDKLPKTHTKTTQEDALTTQEDITFDDDTDILKISSTELPKTAGISLEKGIPQKNISPDVVDDIELDINFSLDDGADTPPSPQQPLQTTTSKPAQQAIDTDNGIELDIDFSLDDDADTPPSPQQPLQTTTAKPLLQPIDTDNGIELDIDFSLDDDDADTPPPPPQPLQKPTPKPALQPIDTDSGIELDIDFSLDDDADATPPPPQPLQKPTPKPALQPIDTDSGIELDIDFSLDDDADVPPPQPLQKPTPKPAPQPIDTDSGIELDIDFSLDDDADATPPPPQPLQKPTPKPALQPIDTDSGIELDIDFSLDDDADATPPPQPLQKPTPKPALQPIDTDSGIELDMDFSLDDDADATPPQPLQKPTPKPALQPIDTDSGIELDIDFSLDDIQIPTPSTKQDQKKSSVLELDDTLELELDLSWNENSMPSDNQKETVKPASQESKPNLDLNFSKEPDLNISNQTNSDLGIELEIEDDSEFDFDFSSDSTPEIKTTDKTESLSSSAKTESISPMDMDFSSDEEELYNDEDTFGEDTEDEDYEESLTGIKSTISSNDFAEKKVSLSKTDHGQTTLGGQPIKISSSSTLMGERANLFEDSVLFEKKKKTKVGMLAIIPILLIIIAIAGYAVSIKMGINIPYLSDVKIPYIDKIPYIGNALSPKPEPVKLSPDRKTINGKFIKNSIAGRLFVVTGQVTNYSKIPCKDIKVEGTLIGTNKVKVKNKIVLCGNVITDEQLLSLDMNAIDSILFSSDENKKFTVESGQSIPFMIVFSNFPDNLENFTVAVKDFKRITR